MQRGRQFSEFIARCSCGTVTFSSSLCETTRGLVGAVCLVLEALGNGHGQTGEPNDRTDGDPW